jgi:hypothetical protein
MRYKFFLFFLIFIQNFLNSQTIPEQINYQGLARDASGQPLAGQNITVSFTIWQGSPGGTNAFTESHNKTTNNFGLFDLRIGSNNTTAFQSINWANGPYFLEVAINGISIGSQQMVSVPYALYAKSAGSVNLQAGSGISITGGSITNTAPGITYTSGTNVSITSGSVINATPSLVLNSNSLSISGGNTVLLPSSASASFVSNGIATINPTSGSSFTITTPSPTFINGQNIDVTGTYPQFTISSSPSLALNGGSLSITGGNTVVLPSATVATVSGLGNAIVTQPVTHSFVVNVPQQTLSIGGTGLGTSYSLQSTSGGTVALPETTLSVNLPHNISSSPGGFNKTITIFQPTLITPGFPLNNIISVNSSTNLTYTLTAPPASLSINNGSGTSTLTLSHGTTVINSVTFPNGNSSGNFWSLSGNTLTSANFLGSTNNFPVAFYANNALVMKLLPVTGTAGILALGEAAQPFYTPQSLAHFMLPNSSFTSALRLGHGNQPSAEWHFDVDGTSNMFLKNELYPSNSIVTFSNSGFVGINTPNPQHRMEVSHNGSNSAIYVQNAGNGDALNAIKTGGSSGYAGFFSSVNTISNSVVHINNNNPGIGLEIQSTNTSSTSAFYASKAAGTQGNVINLISSNPSNTMALAHFNQSHGGVGLDIASNGTNHAVSITKNTNFGHGILINMGAPTLSNGIHITHSGTSGGNGLLINKSGFGQALFATSSGTGSTLYSEKTSGLGEAAAFVNSSSTNTFPVIFAQNTNNGQGPVIVAHNHNGPGDVIVANAQSSNSKNSLVLDNGHIKSTATSVPTLNIFATNTFTSNLTSSLLLATSTDVKGQVSASFNNTLAIGLGEFIRFKITFSKSYSSQPVVIVTPVDTLLPEGVVYHVKNVTTNDFEIEVQNVSFGWVGIGNSIKFNYYVIE